MPKQKPKYSKREKHLLDVIAHLRGSACDAWARLNFIFVRRPIYVELDDAIYEHAKPSELKEGEEQLSTPLLGAGLPWSRPDELPLEEARRQKAILDKRSRWSGEKLRQSGHPKSSPRKKKKV